MKITNLYKVETLDHRFAPPGQAEQKPLADAQPSKWNTPEYYIYYLFFLTIPPLMFKAVYDVSQPSHPNYARYEQLLSPGWIPGRKVDNSDAQYRGFRDNIPYMAVVLCLHPLLRKAYDRWAGDSVFTQANGSAKQRPEEGTAADARLARRIRFDLGFATIFLLALHGFSALKVLLLVYLNYQIATALPRRYVPITTWIFNIGLLFVNELYHGYPFAKLAGNTSTWGAWLDSYGGLIPRWEVLFNFTVLRLIAFNFDYIWMRDRRESSPVEKKSIDPSNLPEKERLKYGATVKDFTFHNYLAYTLYSPLYLAGPIINFNDYICQSRYQLSTISRSRIVPYAIRFIICLLTMEVVLHYLYAVAISKSNPDWTAYTPFQLSMLGYFNLHVIWLKLLLPWRFFRLWALLDGVDAPENMVRCMSDNYSTMAFWRSWHRSFNQWVTRYIYIPLGGSRVGKVRAVMNFLAVFTFVAIWHDINLRLLIWGWLVVLFVLPEAIATLLFPHKAWKDSPNAYRWLCGIGAVGNVLMMMAANLVGFALGLDGLKGLVDGIVSTLGGRVFLLAACITLFVGAQVMFEVREAEKRRGINMKC
ncbi:MBOAT, membrane-bound O-acyltransferase family-domain-containing protein [Neohortaea acidophila]|uniref:MBOAT, membrane-bound O-acyltransferase family-domain-containing protein n=1 Tax=Neohortaea acidophila TaxID=245834 RepID=A0A6A6PP88_9PEZI|nr:MBOAT, membrane-bound O-acyltransferase family-domain-containing protein [Neohortaea acidophila]KAF2481444.1 MBOAT, membrane-bound O-acyltransferase family-domain-containing protein [Neohortaea acidophila]